MALEEEIGKRYNSILISARSHDLCFEQENPYDNIVDGGMATIKEGKNSEYQEMKKKLELDIAEWMLLLRKSIEAIPDESKQFKERIRMDVDGEYTVKEYENMNFTTLLSFFESIKKAVENYSDNGILGKLEKQKHIYPYLRNLRSKVLSFTQTLKLFVPEKMVTIEQQVELIFRLRDLGMEEIAEELEEIDKKDANTDKCLSARYALENYIETYCKNNNIEIHGFFQNLDNAIKNGLTEKDQRKSIAAHYSFISKIIHKEIEANSKNTLFAVNGVLNILDSLTQGR